MTNGQVFRRLLHLLAPLRWQVAVSAGLSFLTVAASVGLMGTSGYLISAAGLHPATLLLLWVPIVGVRFFGISRGVFRYLERLMSHDATFRLLSRLRVTIFERLADQVSSLPRTESFGDLLNAVTADVDTLQNFYLRAVGPPLSAGLTTLLVFVLLCRIRLDIGIVGAGALLVTGVIVSVVSWMRAQGAGIVSVDERAKLATLWTDAVHGMQELTVYGQTETVLAQLASRERDVVNAERHLRTLTGTVAAAVTAMGQLSALAVVWVASPWVQRHQVPNVDVAVIAMVVLAAFEAVAPLPAAFTALEQCLVAGRRVWSITGVQKSDETTAVAKAHPHGAAQHAIFLQGVSAGYQVDSAPVLQGLDLTLEPGQHVAIVGSSGAGKTTLFRLLTRELTPKEGFVYVSGKELTAWTEDALLEQFAVVPQQTYLFHGTIAENLRIGKPDASLAELIEAARQAQILAFVTSLPNGFETSVGELGMRLSGGQRQRIALARALLRRSAILLLDEPTTGLDPQTAQSFLHTLRLATADRTVLLITHQAVGVDWMDEIAVMKDGQIIERGRPQTLMQREGLYARMWRRQKSWSII